MLGSWRVQTPVHLIMRYKCSTSRYVFLSRCYCFLTQHQGQSVWDEEEMAIAAHTSQPAPPTQPQSRYGSSDEEDDQDEVDADSLEVSHWLWVVHGYTYLLIYSQHRPVFYDPSDSPVRGQLS